MRLKLIALMVFLFSSCLVYGQNSLNDFLTVKLIDSLKNANGYGVLGYKSLHLKADGNTVYLAAKKIWNQDEVDTATIILGKRVNGDWEFNDIHTTAERVYESNVRLSLDELNNPIIFYKDRTFVNGYAKDGVVNVLHNEDNSWGNYTAVTFKDNSTKGEIFEAFGSGTNPGFVMLESYWSDVQKMWYYAYSVYDYNTDVISPAVVYNLDSLTQYYNSFTQPAVTEDGEYFAHSCVIPTSAGDAFNVGLFVYKKGAANQWSLDFKYVSDTLSSAWPYLYPYSVAIGKDSNGDILLLAKNDVENPFFRKSNGVWTKVEDNYPIASGVDSPGASGRYLNNEKIQFSSDGTALWGDIDGCPAYPFSAETSFKTLDGHWGVIYCPPAPGYAANGGQYCKHDFTITGNDTLIIVYEFAPYDPENTVYLLEAKAYIPDIVNYVSKIPDNSNDFAPNSFTLFQNYPNPFNPSTTIQFDLRKSGHITLKVFDISGREVETLLDERKGPGHYKVKFDGSGLASGVYLYHLSNGSVTKTQKMILMK